MTNDLVAGDDRQMISYVPVDNMKIGAAYAAGRYLDEKLPRARHRRFPLDELERATNLLKLHRPHALPIYGLRLARSRMSVESPGYCSALNPISRSSSIA